MSGSGIAPFSIEVSAVTKPSGDDAFSEFKENIPGMSSNPLHVVRELVAAYKDYHVVREHEHTKRRQIEADEKVALADIAAKRDVFMDYLTRSFDERAQGFVSLFKRLDRALESGDAQTVAVMTAAIVDLAKSSPFKELSSISATRRALKDPDHNWDL